jgi:hypothetical protein
LAVLIAVVLVVIHQRRVGGSTGGRSQAPNALLVAIVLAGAVGLASLLRGIVELTVAHQAGAVKFGHFVDGLAALPISAATILWGLRIRTQGDAGAPPMAPAAGPPADLAPTEFGAPTGGYRPPPAPPGPSDPTTPYHPPPLP